MVKASNARPPFYALGCSKRMRQWTEAGLFESSGSQWRNLKQVWTPFFSPTQLDGYVPLVLDSIHRVVGPTFDAVALEGAA